MKKVLLGLISIILVGQASFAQPVSDQAIIPIGITIQSVMRLTITKGGNMEFVFSSADDLTNGIPAAGFGASYETTGNIVTTQNWGLELMADAPNFYDDGGGITLPLNVMEFSVNTTNAATLGDGGAALPYSNVILATASATAIVLLENNTGNRTSSDTFAIQWACGASDAGGIAVPNDVPAGRYAVNFVLTLVAN